MPKLHELLAIEANLETQAAKVRADLANTFEKKRHLFEEKRLLFTPNTEGAQVVTEQQTDIQTTVQKELAWVQPHLAKALNASYQVAEANTQARADIILEDSDTPLVKDVPATSLLELQKRLAEILHLAQAIPTLDPAKGFVADSQRGPGIYKAREIRKTRTTKQPKVIVKYEATKEHPAQTELYSADLPLGIIEEQEWSGMMTPAEKAAVLDRIEILSRAVRSARSRANEQAVDTTKKIAPALLGYIFG
jgi:hypothetical protein